MSARWSRDSRLHEQEALCTVGVRLATSLVSLLSFRLKKILFSRSAGTTGGMIANSRFLCGGCNPGKGIIHTNTPIMIALEGHNPEKGIVHTIMMIPLERPSPEKGYQKD